MLYSLYFITMQFHFSLVICQAHYTISTCFLHACIYFAHKFINIGFLMTVSITTHQDISEFYKHLWTFTRFLWDTGILLPHPRRIPSFLKKKDSVAHISITGDAPFLDIFFLCSKLIYKQKTHSLVLCLSVLPFSMSNPQSLKDDTRYSKNQMISWKEMYLVTALCLEV